MSTHRATRAALAIALAASACVPWIAAAPRALAQAPSGATLALVAQTPFTTLKEPEVRFTVAATNNSTDAMDGLSLNVTIGQPIRSITQYQSSLTEGPGSFPLGFQSFPQTGTLSPGQTRRFSIVLDLTEVISPFVLNSDSLVYPVQIVIGTGTLGTPAGLLNSALIHLVRTPESRMRLSWWAEITAPPAFDPQGRLADPTFEASIAPGGSLGSEVEALARLADDPGRSSGIDVAIEPAVVEQLVRMRAGYTRVDGTEVAAGKGSSADAAAMLKSLAKIASSPSIQVSAMPFSAPLIPSLLSNGLAPDLDRQMAAGADELSSALGDTTSVPVMRPPQGALDDPSVDALVRAGVTTLFGDVDTVTRPPQPNDFAPLPTATLATGSGAEASLILPDPDTEALVSDPTLQTDPVQQAQVILGEIAAVWREAPAPAPQPDGSDTIRGIAVGLPAGLPAGLWTPLLRRLADAPFIDPMRAQDFVAQVNPAGAIEPLRTPSLATFSRFYAGAIRDERRSTDAYRSMLGDVGTVPDQLEQDLLYAEAGVYVGQERIGRTWFDQVHTVTRGVFSQILPPAPPGGPPTYTFTSNVGTIPIRMGDPGPTPLTVVVQLQSAYFTFPDGATQTVTLDRPNQVVSFRVSATAGSQDHAIRMRVRAPSPSGLFLDQQFLAVHTATVNAIALGVTLAAALGLVLLWARRLVRRRRGAHAG